MTKYLARHFNQRLVVTSDHNFWVNNRWYFLPELHWIKWPKHIKPTSTNKPWHWLTVLWSPHTTCLSQEAWTHYIDYSRWPTSLYVVSLCERKRLSIKLQGSSSLLWSFKKVNQTNKGCWHINHCYDKAVFATSNLEHQWWGDSHDLVSLPSVIKLCHCFSWCD